MFDNFDSQLEFIFEHLNRNLKANVNEECDDKVRISSYHVCY